MNTIEVDLRTSTIKPFLVWKELHKIYFQHHPEISWDLMCDYKIIEDYFQDRISKFYWSFAVDLEYTNITKFNDTQSPEWTTNQYQIEVTDTSAIITKL